MKVTSIKSRLKQITPKPIWRSVSNTYWWWHNRGRHQWASRFDPRLRISREKIKQYKNIYKGQRCFIWGNGPSLRKIDLSLLKNEINFGLNRIYLIYSEIGYSSTYLLSVNDLVLEQCAQEFDALQIPKFISWRGRNYFEQDRNLIFLDTDYTQRETFTKDMAGRVYEGCTVTYVALQLAFYMGFETAILIGVDHHFETKGPPNETVISAGQDPNHFHPEYFGEGFSWQLPDYRCSERAYRMAREAFEAEGRRVLDATVEGNLEVFPKVEFQSLFQNN